MLYDKMKEYNNQDYAFELGGDFNLSRVDADRIGGSPKHRKRSNIELNRILEEFELMDVFRAFHKGPAYTWKANKIARRLDYFFAPISWKSNIKSIEIVRTCGLSDHDIVLMNVESDSFFPRGPGTWKLNNLILEEEQYITYMRKCIKEQLEHTQNQTDPHQRYEQLKCMVAANTKKYCKARAQRNRDNEKRLKQDLQLAIHNYSVHLSDENVAKLKEIEQELLQITLTRDKGARLRSRLNWLQQGEKPNSFFLGLEKNRSEKKAILSLKAKDGKTIIKGKVGIQAEIERYMKETISNDNSTSLANSEELISSVADKALGGIDYQDLDRRLEVSEIEYA